MRNEDIPDEVAHDLGRANDTERESSLGSLDEGAIGRTKFGWSKMQPCVNLSRERRIGCLFGLKKPPECRGRHPSPCLLFIPGNREGGRYVIWRARMSRTWPRDGVTRRKADQANCYGFSWHLDARLQLGSDTAKKTVPLFIRWQPPIKGCPHMYPSIFHFSPFHSFPRPP